MFQDAQLNLGAKTSSSSPAVSPEEPTASPSTSSAEDAAGTSSPEEQTLVQPIVAQSEAGSSSLPIDLSTKKSPEPDSSTAAAAFTAITASQGINNFL